MYEELARCRLCEHFDRDSVFVPSAAIYFTEKPKSNLCFEVDLVPGNSPAWQGQMSFRRQPPEGIYPTLDELAVKRVFGAQALGAVASKVGELPSLETVLFKGRFLAHGALISRESCIIDNALKSALQSLDRLGHLAARDLQHLDHSHIVVCREGCTHELP